MKYILIISGLLVSSLISKSQWTTGSGLIYYNGNVGIGTTSPGTSALSIEKSNADGGASDAPTISVKNTSVYNPNGSGYNIAAANFWAGNGAVLGQFASNYGIGATAPWNSGSGFYITTRTDHPIVFVTGTSSTEKVRITSAGNVGIGTGTPYEKFQIGSTFTFHDGGHKKICNNSYYDPNSSSIKRINAGPIAEIGFSNNGELYFATAATGTANSIVDNYNYAMFITNDGNVGIGTVNMPASDAKLAVEGNIYSKKIKVTQSGWADYVFHASYRLRPLSEVEQYIRQHHHLPEVPSAADVEKDGIDLGDNQATLLKKIEELTLYLIEQNKKLEALEKEMQQLRRPNNVPAN